MMSLLEFINMQVMTNRRKDATAATWIYFDEIHVLLKDPMSSNFLYFLLERFRSTMPTPPASRRIFRTIWITPWRMRCFPTASLSLCCGNRKVWNLGTPVRAVQAAAGISAQRQRGTRHHQDGQQHDTVLQSGTQGYGVYKLITTKPGEATAEK